MTDREKLIELFVESAAMDYKDSTEYFLANGVTFQKWIPVSERLPDVGGIYLVVVKYKYDFEKEFTYDTDVATYHFGFDCTYIDG